MAASERFSVSPISLNGRSNTSRSTKAARSSGESVSSTTSIAIETESATSATAAGSSASGVATIGSGNQGPTYCSRRVCCCRSRFSASRVAIRIR